MQANKKFYITSAALATLSIAASNSTSTSSVPSSCSVSSIATAQSDLDSYGSCQTIVGTLSIGENLVNPTLSNVEKIVGDLNITGSSQIVSFAAPNLKTVSGELKLYQLTNLQTATFSQLTSVGSITLVALPNVNSIVLTALDSASNVLISDTNLETLSGFQNLENVDIFDINNNFNLASIISPLQTVSNSLSISANGGDTVVSFDDLVWANNITVRDAGSVSFKGLQNVNSSLGFLNNSLTSVNMKNLTETGGSLSFVANDYLTSLDFTNLKSIGGALIIANNSKLANASAFPQLAKIGGALDVIGSFSSLDLPSLKSIKGGADVNTTASNFSCDALNKLQKSGNIQGDKFVCNAASSSTSVKLDGSSTSTSAGSSTGSSNSASATNGTSSSTTKTKTTKNAAVNYNTPVMGSFVGGLAAIAVALL